MARGAFVVYSERVGKLADALDDDGLRALTEAASFEVKNQALRLLVRTVGGDRRMSRFGSKRSRGKVRGGVGYDLERPGAAVVKYRPLGFWALLEGGSPPHAQAVDRRGRPRTLQLPDGSFRFGPFQHPGTRPKRVLSRSLDAANREVPAAVERALVDLLASTLEV